MAIVVVDGERFEVRRDPLRPQQVDFVWLSGPNPGYGFTTASPVVPDLDHAALERSIRGFLAQINPETGYID